VVDKSRKIPAYRLHKPTGQAVVRLDGRDFYLGKHGTEASREKYRRTIAEWLTASVTPTSAAPSKQPVTVPTVAEIILAFWRHAEVHYRSSDGTTSEELGNIKAALRPLRSLYGDTPARDFGPLALRAVRDSMIGTGLARTSVNARVDRIRRAFRWAASVELVPSSVVQALSTVAGLQKGRTTARETEAVGPVPIDHVERTLPFLSRPVAALVRLQLLTGMRPGEACAMRGRDLTPGEVAWTYRPGSHKTAWRGKVREIAIGPKAQEVIREFRKPDNDAFLFDPREAVSEHHAARKAARESSPTPSEKARRVGKPGEKHGRRYSRASYRNAILRACRKNGIPPWTPNQLRHTAATTIRAKYGLEAAQAVLGHAKADVTQVYAQRDSARAREVMGEAG
jgi:integrase